MLKLYIWQYPSSRLFTACVIFSIAIIFHRKKWTIEFRSMLLKNFVQSIPMTETVSLTKYWKNQWILSCTFGSILPPDHSRHVSFLVLQLYSTEKNESLNLDPCCLKTLCNHFNDRSCFTHKILIVSLNPYSLIVMFSQVEKFIGTLCNLF